MLILTRKAGERIMIGDDISIVVLESRGGRVRLGLVAPGEIPIQREEIRHRIARENRTRLTKAEPRGEVA